MNKTTFLQKVSQILLGLFLLTAGISHLTFLRKEFLAQVPPWLPIKPYMTVVLSGGIEIILGVSLILIMRYKVILGWTTAAFFVAIFPGNIAQLVEHRDAFGLNSDFARWMRLPFQLVLIFAALWSTGAWKQWRTKVD